MSCGTSSKCDGCSVSEKRGRGTSSVFNWLSNIDDHNLGTNGDLVEIQFKDNRKGYYKNAEKLPIKKGGFVAVEAETGYDVGKVSLVGEIVALQIKRKNINTEKTPLKRIYRIAQESDFLKQEEAVSLESSTLLKAKEIIKRNSLSMKLIDVEYQADKTKAVFYYTAEKRVDFRDLIREFSRTFSIKIEMKQIGVRQEAAKVGGIGSCGRELCCSTWMTNTPSVTTSSVRYQQLSINPQKISGQCGKLKCCLNFELDSYLDELKAFPKSKKTLKTELGDLKQIKIDVFKNKLWYIYKNKDHKIVELNLNQANKIIEVNNKGKVFNSMEELLNSPKQGNKKTRQFEDSITRFSKKLCRI